MQQSAPTSRQEPITLTLKRRVDNDQTRDQQYRNAHQSVKNILRKYPGIKLPKMPLKCHYGPYITLVSNEVTEWYKKLNYSDEKIKRLIRKASGKSSRETSKAIKKNLTSFSHPTITSDKTMQEENEQDLNCKKIKLSNSIAETAVAIPNNVCEESSNQMFSIPHDVNQQSTSTSSTVNKQQKHDHLNEGQRRKLTIRKKIRPITYNEDTFADFSTNTQYGTVAKKSTGSYRPSRVSDNSSNESASSGIAPSLHTTENQNISETINNVDVAKKNFVNSLALTPRLAGETNVTSDSLLISHINRSQTIYTCKVCDSPHYSLKDLKVHQKKTHTKCPFCYKKFRTLENRDIHVKHSCTLTNIPTILKEPKLCLQRVEEIEGIRNRYSNAFLMQNDDYESDASIIGVTDSLEPLVPAKNDREGNKLLSEPDPTVRQNLSASIVNHSASIESQDVIKTVSEPIAIQKSVEPENFLKAKVSDEHVNNTSDITLTSGETLEGNNKTMPSVIKPLVRADVICISDEEGDSLKVNNKDLKSLQAEQKIKLVNMDLVKNINTNDTDINVLRQIITEVNRQGLRREHNEFTSLQQNQIVDGENSKTKIFKNLRTHLHTFKIPVEIAFGEELRVQYKKVKQHSAKKIIDSWKSTNAIDLKTYVPETPIQVSNPKTTVSVNAPVNQYCGALLLNALIPTNAGNVYAVHNLPSTQTSLSNVKSYGKAKSQCQLSSNLTPSIEMPAILTTAKANSTGSKNNIVLSQHKGRTLQESTIPQYGPLPIIESVKTVEDLAVTSTAHIVMASGKPVIRVKNLSELS